MSGPRPRRSRAGAVVVAVLAAAVALWLLKGYGAGSAPGGGSGAGATSTGGPGASRSGQPAKGTCALSSLPAQAADTVGEIHSGGPFRYRQDGVVFDNRERRLPIQAHGYYHEFTVTTPGSPDRGTRRVIAGGGTSTDPAQLYYTGDHYASFCLVTGAG